MSGERYPRWTAAPLVGVLLLMAACMASLASADTLTDDQVRQQMIQESIAEYPGHCPRPYNLASNGSHCGKRGAWSKPGGYAPLCYRTDISDDMVKAYREQHGL